ncbi:MAG: TatD family hydrolase [Uliginosibacterium sp.]|nr:TatD family hydrolase [Uliginosibacterium sp.]
MKASPSSSVADLIERAAHRKVVGIGETGLDYYQMEQRKGGRSVADMEWQRNRFRVHIRAAPGPTSIDHPIPAKRLRRHHRDPSRKGGRRLGSVGGVFHCFTETEQVAPRRPRDGLFISFSGILTFKRKLAA